MVRILVAVRVVVAGFGNVLRSDDGFGVEVARRLAAAPLPDCVTIMDVGIGGIHLVQELMDGVDALVVVDAVDSGRAPGTVVVLRPEVQDLGDLPALSRRDQLADMHYATPQRALMLAAGLGVLPGTTMLVGCQPVDAERFAEGLSEPVTRGVGLAIAEVQRVVSDLGVVWPAPRPTADPGGAAAHGASPRPIV